MSLLQARYPSVALKERNLIIETTQPISTRSLGTDEELKAKNGEQKTEEKEGELLVKFSTKLTCESEWEDLVLSVEHCGTRIYGCDIPDDGEDFFNHPVVDGVEFLKFLKSQAIRLPSAPALDEMAVTHCLIRLLTYITAKCVGEGYGDYCRGIHLPTPE